MLLPDLSTPKIKNVITLTSNDITPMNNLSTAQVLVIGDPPDTYEVLERQCFNGAGYKQFYRLCAAISVPQHQMYLTNCIKAKLQRVQYKKLFTLKGYRCPEWGELQLRLLNEIKDYPGQVIITMGEAAMTMLLDSPKFDSLTKYRGSIYSTNDFPHLQAILPDKFICPTYSVYDCSPRMKPLNFYTLINDFQKALTLNDSPELANPKVVIHTAPTYIEAVKFLTKVLHSPVTSIDIEATPSHVTCFALTCSATEGMCIPLMNNAGNYWLPSQEVELWRLFAKILGDPNIQKIAQNGMFDFMFLLRTLGIHTANFAFDTMIAQHITWTDLPKGLDFLTSIYSYFPYYKDEGKQSHLKAIKDWPMYWNYNAKDAIYTHFITTGLSSELSKADAWKDFNYMMNLHAPLMEMEAVGILTEQEKIIAVRASLDRKVLALKHGLNKVAKQPLNANSAKQMVSYFYGHCMIKPYINRKTGQATCDAVALGRIARKKVRGAFEAKLIIKLRKYHKLLSVYFKDVTDSDKRLRSTYKITGTISGRLSSEATYFGTGVNMQNQPKAFKKYLCSDPDYILIEVDLARAEAHCVAYLAQDTNMINAFESGIDVHTFNASKIFGLPMEAVTKKQRSMGKKVVHASNYSMGPQTFSDNLVKDGIYKSKGECGQLLQAYNVRFPSLKRWQSQIDMEVSKTRTLYNMFGRAKKFLGMIGPPLFRNAYSYIPQSTVAELLNRGMIKWYYDKALSQFDYQFLATVHDSTVFQIHKKHALELDVFLQMIHTHLSHEFIHKGREFTIGLDAKVGTHWGEGMIEIPDFNKGTVHDALKQLNFISEEPK